MIYDSLITQIKNIPPADLAAHGVIVPAKTSANGEKTYICPICNNGSGKSGDGIAFKDKGGAWLAKCFKCGRGFDNISLFALHYGLDTRADFTEILKRAAADFGIATDLQFSASKSFNDYHNLTPLKIEKAAPPAAQKPIQIEVENLTAEYIKQVLALPDNLERLPLEDRRGLTLETLRYFHCSYVEKWIHPKIFAEYKLGLRDKSKLLPRTRRLIIPTADGLHYNAVLLNSDRPKFQSNKWKMHAGKKSVPFGIETIRGADYSLFENEGEGETEELEKISDSEDWAEIAAICGCITIEYVIVVEGEIDAMSAWQAYKNSLDKKPKVLDRAFIATGGIAERCWIKAVDSKCKELEISPLFVIMFDNGEAEKLNAESCAKELKKLGYPAAVKLVDRKENL